ncbi:hypothetical protein FBU30_001145 [Linnemannia zychae]|nr:hypothetical protein FBU30_001145 [Linnemannia zychae]
MPPLNFLNKISSKRMIIQSLFGCLVLAICLTSYRSLRASNSGDVAILNDISPVDNCINYMHHGQQMDGLQDNPNRKLSLMLTAFTENKDENLYSQDKLGAENGVDEHKKHGDTAHSSFEATLKLDPDNQYITYIPCGGLTNQFYGMIRAMEVAKTLNRTLIIPPMTSSLHDKPDQNERWSKFFDLPLFQELTGGTKIIELSELRDTQDAGYSLLNCMITCSVGSYRDFDYTALEFMRQWKLNVTLSPLATDARDLDEVAGALKLYRRHKLICISDAFRILVRGNLEWHLYGQNLHFTTELENFTQQLLHKRLVNSEIESTYELTQGVVPTYKYTIIHIRRGDYIQFCKNKFVEMVELCLPSTEEIAKRINQIQVKYNTSGSLMGTHPIFVATNEQRPEELRKFADLGWEIMDHRQTGATEALGIFGPAMVDNVLMANAQTLVGIRVSTFAEIGGLRQSSWHKRHMEYI